MRTGALLRESLIAAGRRPTPTIMIALLVAAACIATLVTVGRTAAAEQQILERLDTAGARLVSAQDTSSQNMILPASVVALNAAAGVERAVALSIPGDATTQAQGDGGRKIPLWELQGEASDLASITSGRLPGPGEAIISVAEAAAAGFSSPSGAVTIGARSWSIVGIFNARAPFEQLNDGIIAYAEPATVTPLLYVVARSAGDTGDVANLIRSVIAPTAPTDLSISQPAALAQLQGDVTADLGGLGYSLLIIILTAGSGLVAIVVFADTLVRRADLGRRRALGMSRSALVGFLLTRTAAGAVPGAMLGCLGAFLGLMGLSAAPPMEFAIGVGALAVIAALVACLPPAVAAAFSDPVRVLRTP